jgi:hypothetical protein
MRTSKVVSRLRCSTPQTHSSFQSAESTRFRDNIVLEDSRDYISGCCKVRREHNYAEVKIEERDEVCRAACGIMPSIRRTYEAPGVSRVAIRNSSTLQGDDRVHGTSWGTRHTKQIADTSPNEVSQGGPP